MKSIFRSLFSSSLDETSSGSRNSFLPDWFARREPKRLLLLGLDAAGKTTFLYKIKSSQDNVETVIPTIGFNVEQLELKDLQFKCWDIGGCDKIRPLWRYYMQNLSGIVFMVDSSDYERFQSAKEELGYFLRESHPSIPVLIISNKVDLPHSKPVVDVIKALGLDKLRNRRWEILPAVVTLKEYAKPCLEWIRIVMSDPESSRNAALFKLIVDHGGYSSRAYFLKFPESSKDNEQETLKEMNIETSPAVPPDQLNRVILPPSSASFVVVVDLPDNQKKQPSEQEKPELTEVQKQVQSHDALKLEAIWKDWLSRRIPSDQPDDDAFLHQLQATYSLSSWDHFNHLRIAYVLLRLYGVQEGFQQIETSIKNYIQNNQTQTNGRSFHLTMTRFWCHFVLYWIVREALEEGNRDEGNDDTKAGKQLQPQQEEDRFHSFLLFVYRHRSPATDIAQSNLFRNYFTPDRIFSASARESAVMQPNLLSLPFNQITEAGSIKLFDGTRGKDVTFMEENHYWETAVLTIEN